tara:strand:- start:388 stop:717 length:330 start_codon:yes stop_codon:yes gene_type:complete
MDINFENFSKFKILVGTIISIEINKKAKKPAFELDVDFGKEIGIKKTSAQITNYDLDELINSQVIGVTNFPAKNIAGVISEVLVLGALNTNGVQLLRVDQHVPNGTIIS